MKDKGQNITDQLGSLHLPSIFTYLPHLTGHPGSLKPVFKMSKNRYGGKYEFLSLFWLHPFKVMTFQMHVYCQSPF